MPTWQMVDLPIYLSQTHWRRHFQDHMQLSGRRPCNLNTSLWLITTSSLLSHYQRVLNQLCQRLCSQSSSTLTVTSNDSKFVLLLVDSCNVRVSTTMRFLHLWLTLNPSIFSSCLQQSMISKWMDVCTAFLNGDLEEDLYMVPPEGVHCPPGCVWKLE